MTDLALWLQRLKSFAVNALIHTSREEQALNINLSGTRSVNIALSYLIADMEKELGVNPSTFQPFHFDLEQRLGLELKIAEKHYCIPADRVHEILAFSPQDERFYPLEGQNGVLGLLNWHEGLVPVISAAELLQVSSGATPQIIVIYDVGKDLFGLAFDHFVQPQNWTAATEQATLQFLDLSEHLEQLRALRQGLFAQLKAK